ncbi:MAG: hypothetical protein ACK479_06930 [Fluviicola sp.]
MKKNVLINQLLNFINYATESQLDEFADSESKPGLGKTIAIAIKAAQNEFIDAKFTSIDQLKSIKGLGEEKITAMLSAIEKMEDKSFIKSRSMFSFSGNAPEFNDLEGRVKFVPIENSTSKVEGENSYQLFYDKSLDKEKLFQLISNSVNYLNSWQDEWFVIQGNDGKYLSANPTTGVVSFVSAIGTTGMEYFKIHTGLNQHSQQDPNAGTNRDVQKYSFLYAILQCKADTTVGVPNITKSLYIDYADRKVKYGTPASSANFPIHFDIYGIYGQPSWINGQNPFRSFTLLTYFSNTIQNPDQRVFLSQEGAELKGLSASNVGWWPKIWLRYIDVIENISIKGVYDTGNYINMHLNVSNSNSVSFISLNGGQINPQSTQFDMICFYGFWGDRKQIVMKVYFRSKVNNKFLSVDINGVVTCNSTNMGNNETFFVENGWGTSTEDVFLKTYHGKYLYNYIGYAKADSNTPVVFEPFKIIIP